MIRALQLLLCSAAVALTLQATEYTVGFRKSVTVPVPQATAAYTVDPEIAEASANEGIVTIVGKNPGSTHVIVITPEGIQTIEVLIPVPPPLYPKGWVMPRGENASNEMGYFESRYSSLPQQLTNILDFTRSASDISTHFHLATTDFFTTVNNPFNTYGESSFAITSLSYSVKTADRSVTLVDQYVEESPLTVWDATVRGLHWEEGDWFFHAGYTSPAPFQNVFLPLRKEGVFGTGYRYHLTTHSTLIPSLYYLTMPAGTLTGRAGLIGSLLYAYRPSETMHVNAEIAESRGLGGSFDLYYRRKQENLRARVRYTPEKFAALSISNFRGFYSDLAWTRQWSRNWGTDVSFTGDRFNLPGFQETTVNGGVQLKYNLNRTWSAFGGANYSRYQTDLGNQGTLEGLYYPLGGSFNSKHFGATLQHQWSSYTGQDTGGRQWLGSIRAGWGQMTFNAYAERQTQAPTLSFILAQVQGLQQVLTELGVTATTPQQISDFLNSNAALINLQYLKNVTVNIVPVRIQAGGSASWQGHGNQPQIDYEYLYNDDQSVTNSSQVAINRVTATQRIGVANDISLTLAQYRTKTPGQPSTINPLYAVSFRHHFNTAPSFLVFERQGTIRGRVFQDQEGQGNYSETSPGVGEVEIILDQGRRTRTAADGTFHFSRVPEGKHQLVAELHSEKPYYFTTPEQGEAEPGGEVNFGVAYSQSSLTGDVTDDAQHGVQGVVVNIAGEDGRRFLFTSGANGKLLLPRLPAGSYDVSIDADSLPPGYLIEGPAVTRISVVPASPGRVALHLKALRTLGGRVLIYDRAKGDYVPVPNVDVTLNELSMRVVTDNEGRYLFRNLPAGSFVLTVTHDERTINRLVQTPEEPSQQTNINLILGQR